MKALRFLPLVLILAIVSCSPVQVATDYDREVNFDLYQTYAFYKPGVDKAEISDLDKRRILRAIDAELAAKGMNKSETPNLLVSIFTKEKERVNVYQNNFGWGGGWGFGWNPWWWGGANWGTSVSQRTEGSLFIDLIDAKTNQLVWQGIGTANLITSGNIDKKEQRIKEIVQEILSKFPPGAMEE